MAFIVTVGGTKMIEAATREEAAKIAVWQLLKEARDAGMIEVDVCDVDVGWRNKIHVAVSVKDPWVDDSST